MNSKVLRCMSNVVVNSNFIVLRTISVSTRNTSKDHYKLVVVGGGTGGLATAAKFARKLGSGNVAIVEPSKHHYYQPGWTLAGGGLKKPEDLVKDEEDLIPKGCDWIRNKVESFDPENNVLVLDDNNKKIKYDYLIVAVGIQTNFEGIKGLVDALREDDRVVSNYSSEYVKKTFPAIKNFKGGNAIFTFPNTVIKCPGAPQKIMYLADDYFRKNGVRDKAVVMYNTALPVIFGVKKYAACLMEVVKEKNIQLNTRTSLTEVNHKTGEAIFEKLDTPGTFVTYKYSLLHVGPPMKAHDFVKKSKLADPNGFVDVNKETLQHKTFSNVFAIGDCTNVPTSKTAAAIAAQCQILYLNLHRVMNGNTTVKTYDGYTSCPLITGYGKAILAEFDFNGNPLETFPMDQGKQRRLSYFLKKDLMPDLYWHGLIRGYWNGPAFYRKVMHLGAK